MHEAFLVKLEMLEEGILAFGLHFASSFLPRDYFPSLLIT